MHSVLSFSVGLSGKRTEESVKRKEGKEKIGRSFTGGIARLYDYEGMKVDGSLFKKVPRFGGRS